VKGLLLPLALGAVVALVLHLAPDAAGLETWLAEIAGDPQRSRWALPLALAVATLVSEDLTCLAAGALVARGALSFPLAAAACFVGIFVGDVLLFLWGRWCGPAVLARAPCRWFLDAGRVREAADWLERRGAVVILASRFLPGALLPTYFASGALGTSVLRFSAWFALAGLLWTPSLVALAAGVGGGLARVDGFRDRGWVVVLLLAWLLLALAKASATWRGRRLLRAQWVRWTRFEYWPIGLFYLPVFGLAFLRALRGQGLVFTAANPGLPHGGFVGEPKRAIYELLERAGAPLPRTLCLARAEPRTRRESVRAFQEAHGLAFPLVVKPDAGQRGDGVLVVRSAAALEAALTSDEDLVVQEFVPGDEYGLFYVRMPEAPRGELLSITHKVMPSVVGDGSNTLEHLVLADPVTLPMAHVLLARPRAELERVPASGERVQLGELGTHCRGARFLDGNELATPALRAELERIARGLGGFQLGRFDVRAESPAALQAGRFRVLELNGVTSEAGHMYDPRCGLLEAWSSLVGQWRRAYAIGAANAQRGARVSGLGELLAALGAYRALVRRRSAPPTSVATTEPLSEGTR
jgi:membrane protein DedA with SNARE-associated domain